MNDQFNRRMCKLININLKTELPNDHVVNFIKMSITIDEKLKGLSEREAIDVLLSEKPNDASSLHLGVVYNVITTNNKDIFNKFITYINGAGTEYWSLLLCGINMAVMELWNILQESCKEQLINLLAEGFKANVSKIENVCLNYLRAINGAGDFSLKIRHLMSITRIITSCDTWFRGLQTGYFFMSILVTTVAHFIADLPEPLTKDDTIRQELITFFVFIIKTRSSECVVVGRDLLLILMRLSRFPEIAELRKELEENPKAFGFGTLEEVLWKPFKYPTYRLAIELNKKLEFIAYNVRPLDQHFDWLVNQYLRPSYPDSFSLRVEMIRFLIQNNIKDSACYESRASVIQGLLMGPKMTQEQHIYLMLNFWIDWIGFDGNQQTFSLLEAAFGVIKLALNWPEIQPERSRDGLNKGPTFSSAAGETLANQLLDFVCKSTAHFPPVLKKSIVRNLNNAMSCVRITVSPSYFPTVVEHHRIERRVHEQMRVMWPDFLRVQTHGTTPHNVTASTSDAPPRKPSKEVEVITIDDDNNTVEARKKVLKIKNENEILTKGEDMKRVQIKRKGPVVTEKEYEASLDKLGEILRAKTESLQTQWKDLTDDEEKCEAVDAYLQFIFESDLDQEKHEAAAKCLLNIFSPLSSEETVIPTGTNEKDAFTHPIYNFFRTLCFPDHDEGQIEDTIMNMLITMREIDPTVSCLFLYFMKNNLEGQEQEKEKHCVSKYRELAKEIFEKTDEMLAKDLETCAINDLPLFQHILTFVLEAFNDEVISSPLIIECVCRFIDGEQLKGCISTIVRDSISLFRRDTFNNVFMASLTWSSKSQWMFWHLVNAEAVSIEWFPPLIPKLDYKQHSEAVSNILILLRRTDKEPWQGLFRSFFLRSCTPEDLFTVDAMKICIDDEDQLKKTAITIGGMIKKAIASDDNGQKQVGRKGPPKLYLDQIVNHLALFAEHCLGKGKKIADSFFGQSGMQDAFNAINQSPSASTFRSKHQKMFSYMDILNKDEGATTSRSLRANRERGATSKRGGANNDDDVGKKRKNQRYDDDGNDVNKKRKFAAMESSESASSDSD